MARWYRERLSADQAIPVSKACVWLNFKSSYPGKYHKTPSVQVRRKKTKSNISVKHKPDVDGVVGGVFRKNETANLYDKA